jgi:hypothetical protein
MSSDIRSTRKAREVRLKGREAALTEAKTDASEAEAPKYNFAYEVEKMIG